MTNVNEYSMYQEPKPLMWERIKYEDRFRWFLDIFKKRMENNFE